MPVWVWAIIGPAIYFLGYFATLVALCSRGGGKLAYDAEGAVWVLWSLGWIVWAPWAGTFLLARYLGRKIYTNQLKSRQI